MDPHSFIEPHSRAIRVWHWIFVLFVSATLATVLLASTIFRTRNTIPLVEQRLQQNGVTVSEDQARAVAHEFNDRLWDIHRLIGYGLCILLVSRWVIELGQPYNERLKTRMRKAMVFSSTIPIERIRRRQYVNVKTIYLLFYAFIATMGVTGLILAFDDVPYLQQFRQSAKQIHSLFQYVIYAFILIHLIGVIRADLGRYKGIVSGMIHGQKLG
jgi:Ni/Fe-hydrogenase 1 B-type cytochrome subunit